MSFYFQQKLKWWKNTMQDSSLSKSHHRGSLIPCLGQNHFTAKSQDLEREYPARTTLAQRNPPRKKEPAARLGWRALVNSPTCCSPDRLFQCQSQCECEQQWTLDTRRCCVEKNIPCWKSSPTNPQMRRSHHRA
ncbi:uncharacterized protein LOC144581376 isoform X4 [Callithrix jacchus]